MTAIGLLLLAMLWAAISIKVTLWLCPRIFRFTPKDDE